LFCFDGFADFLFLVRAEGTLGRLHREKALYGTAR
jgi:hypothetical protein